MHARDYMFWIKVLACLVVGKTVLTVFLSYGDYFPPNFHRGFLLGREAHFSLSYQIAFTAHVISGPISLLLGIVLISASFRRRWPRWHRRLGRVAVMTVIFVVAPSGLMMAPFAETGTAAALGFVALALATLVTAANGWRTAIDRDFAAHRRWMWRCFALLGSAVVLRGIGGLSDVLHWEGTYPFAAWFSWILPWGVTELYLRSRFGRLQVSR